MSPPRIARTDDEAIKVLKNFAFGKAIETEEEYDILKPYESVGFVHFGYSFEKKESQASLTKEALIILGLGLCENCDDKKRKVRNSRTCRKCKENKDYEQDEPA